VPVLVRLVPRCAQPKLELQPPAGVQMVTTMPWEH